VPLLVQIIRSQSPTRELGKSPLKQLAELRLSMPPPRAGDSGVCVSLAAAAAPEPVLRAAASDLKK